MENEHNVIEAKREDGLIDLSCENCEWTSEEVSPKYVEAISHRHYLHEAVWPWPIDIEADPPYPPKNWPFND